VLIGPTSHPLSLCPIHFDFAHPNHPKTCWKVKSKRSGLHRSDRNPIAKLSRNLGAAFGGFKPTSAVTFLHHSTHQLDLLNPTSKSLSPSSTHFDSSSAPYLIQVALPPPSTMLWYAYLLGVALWAYPQAPKVPSRSMVQVDKLMVTTHIAELLAPPPPVTVTVTVRGKLSLQAATRLCVVSRRKEIAFTSEYVS
jgi:hypothetical protein